MQSRSVQRIGSVAGRAAAPGRRHRVGADAIILVEFAGSSGVGKTTTASRTCEILAREDGGARCAPPRELSVPAVAARMAVRPRLLIAVRHLRRLSTKSDLSAIDWSRRVAATSLALRTARRSSTMVVAPELLFHWIKKLPLDEQPGLRAVGVPVPDLIVHLVTTPAERLRREIARGRPSSSIARASATELENLASRTADQLLSAFPLDSATSLMLRWGEARAGGRLAPDRLLAIIDAAAKRSSGIDPLLHRLQDGGRIMRSAEALRIPRITITTQASTTLDQVASDAARSILDHVRTAGPPLMV